jgi:hypothetical protein
MSYGKIITGVLSKAAGLGSKAKGLGSKAKALGKRAINSQSSSARFDRLLKRNPSMDRYRKMSPTRFVAEDIAHQGIDAVKKHPYISTGAGLVAGDLALRGMYGDEDMSTDDIVAILQAQGFSDDEIGQYLQMHMEE